METDEEHSETVQTDRNNIEDKAAKEKTLTKKTVKAWEGEV